MGEELLAWARNHQYIVFTNDLDFGSILAASGAGGPSVLQVRTQDVTPTHLTPTVAAAVRKFEAELAAGAIVSIDEGRGRARLLPI